MNKAAIRAARWETFHTFLLVYSTLFLVRVAIAWYSGKLTAAFFSPKITSLIIPLAILAFAAFQLLSTCWLKPSDEQEENPVRDY